MCSDLNETFYIKKTISQNGGVYDLDNSLYETDPDYFEWLDNIKYRYGSGLYFEWLDSRFGSELL